MANAADMMMARDAAARAMNAMNVAEARAKDDMSMEAAVAVRDTRAAWVKAVKNVEAVQRRVWAAQDRVAA